MMSKATPPAQSVLLWHLLQNDSIWAHGFGDAAIAGNANPAHRAAAQIKPLPSQFFNGQLQIAWTDPRTIQTVTSPEVSAKRL
jgi:hypothetical protein